MERDRGEVHIPEGYVDYDGGVLEVNKWVRRRRRPFLITVLGVGSDVGKTTFCGEIERGIITRGKFYPIHLGGLENQRVEDWQRVIGGRLPAFVYEDTFYPDNDKRRLRRVLVAKVEIILSDLNRLVGGWMGEIGRRDVLPVILTDVKNGVFLEPVKLGKFSKGVWVFNQYAQRKGRRF